MRRALGFNGHLDGPVVELVLDWHRRNLGYVVGKRAGAPEGAVVVFDVTGPTAERIAIGVENGRAALVDGSGPADTTLTLDVEAYNALLCGRWTASTALDQGRLRIDGDVELGRRVADAMGYVF
jgi:ubiquinone biosynthesis protein UbiJ